MYIYIKETKPLQSLLQIGHQLFSFDKFTIWPALALAGEGKVVKGEEIAGKGWEFNRECPTTNAEFPPCSVNWLEESPTQVLHMRNYIIV